MSPSRWASLCVEAGAACSKQSWQEQPSSKQLLVLVAPAKGLPAAQLAAS